VSNPQVDYIYIYVCMYMYMYIYMYVYIHLYTYMYMSHISSGTLKTTIVKSTGSFYSNIFMFDDDDNDDVHFNRLQ
jgi:hypothetical protein